MDPQHDDQHGRHDAGDPANPVTRYAAAPPAEADATNYRPASPAAADTDATRYTEQSTDPDRTNYRAPASADGSDFTNYAAGPADPHATGYTPSDGKVDVPSDAALPCRFGGYELLAVIGHGGMGVVYKARQLEPDRLVALKMIRAGELATEQDVRRFRLEANEAARLDHPHIVPVYEVGEHHGRHFFTMRLLEGGNLAEHLDAYRQDRKAAARLVARVARAVHHAHQHQLLHRDLKPGNILLDAQGQPHVADFGLAKRMGGSGEASQSAGPGAGTPEYMAPEQARGERRLTTAVDVYGLGGVLYALLAGRPPFKGASPWETIEQLLSREPCPPSGYGRGCPRDLETICLRCLQKDPARRYASAEALAGDLERYLEGRPIAGRPVGPGERLWRWSRRKPVLAGMLAALIGVVLASLAGLTGLYLHAEKQRRMAEDREAGALAISKFYEDYVLAAPRPKGWEGGMGKDVSLKEALNLAAPNIDEALAGQPVLEARVRHTLGSTYWYLGQFEAAYPQLEKAYQIRLARLGPDHPDTLTSLDSLAMERWKQDKLTEAVALERQALGKRRRVLGPEHPDTLWSQINLGLFLTEAEGGWGADPEQLDEPETILRDAIEVSKRVLGPEHHHTLYGQMCRYCVLGMKGKSEDSLALRRQTLEGRRHALGADHPDTLRSMEDLAWDLEGAGKLDEAEPLCRQALEARRRILGDGHIETFWSLNQLAWILADRGQPAKVEEVRRQTLADCQRLRGPDDPETLNCLTNLGEFLSDQDKLDEAGRLLRQAVERSRRKLGPEHGTTLLRQNKWAGLLAKQGKAKEAEALYRQTLEALRRVRGPEHNNTLNTQNSLAGLLRAGGRPAEAEALYREVLEVCRRARGPEHKRTLTAQTSLALALQDQGKWDEAEGLHRQTLEARRRVLGPEASDTVGSMRSLAGVLQQQHKLPEAEGLLREAVEANRKGFGPENAVTLATQQELASLLGEEHKVDEAAKVYRDLVAAQRKTLGPDHPDLAGTLAGLGDLLAGDGRAAEAEPVLRECLAIREKKLPPGDWRVASARSLLGGALARQKKFAEAEPHLRAGYEGFAKAADAPADLVARAFDRVTELYEKWGKPQQAEAWRKKQPTPGAATVP